jgi:hypothetical protein
LALSEDLTASMLPNAYTHTNIDCTADYSKYYYKRIVLHLHRYSVAIKPPPSQTRIIILDCTSNRNSKMAIPTDPKQEPWEIKAVAKRESILNAIPQEWRLNSEIPSAGRQGDINRLLSLAIPQPPRDRNYRIPRHGDSRTDYIWGITRRRSYQSFLPQRGFGTSSSKINLTAPVPVQSTGQNRHPKAQLPPRGLFRPSYPRRRVPRHVLRPAPALPRAPAWPAR